MHHSKNQRKLKRTPSRSSQLQSPEKNSPSTTTDVSNRRVKNTDSLNPNTETTPVAQVKPPRNKPTLNRQTFQTPREMDFFSEKELITQTGHQRDEWPQVVFKELVDNALDACEDHDIAPTITVAADERGISVSDNGPGLPESTLKGACDFGVRCSSREMYVAPDRGAQGNAIMTLLSMPYVLDPEQGRFICETNGRRHVISCRANPITQRAEVDDDTSDSTPRPGTMIRLEWARRDDGWDDIFEWGGWEKDFHHMARAYALFNPHLTLTLDWFGEVTEYRATTPDWAKWKPNKPTSALWYTLENMERLIGAIITDGRNTGTDITVQAFVRQFHSLTGTAKAKAICDESDLTRVHLSTLIRQGESEDFDHDRIDRLLVAMKERSKPVKPRQLGVIGEDHFRKRAEELGAELKSFVYDKQFVVENDIPCVVETAFAYMGRDNVNREIFGGVNWSAGIKDPFRSVGADGLRGLLTAQKAGHREPILFALHLAKARVEYTDRGKSAIVLRKGGENDG